MLVHSGCFLLPGFFIQATLTALIGYTTSQTTAELLLIFGFGVGGSLTWSGLSVNIIDISPRYAALLMGISNCVATVPGIIGPPLAGALTPDEVGSMLDFHYSSISIILITKLGKVF